VPVVRSLTQQRRQPPLPQVGAFVNYIAVVSFDIRKEVALKSGSLPAQRLLVNQHVAGYAKSGGA
jgi:hypothetical protein